MSKDTKNTNKMKNKKKHNCQNTSKTQKKIVEREHTYIPFTQIHDRSLSRPETSTSIKCRGPGWLNELDS